MSVTHAEQAYQARIWSLISLALRAPSQGNLSALVRQLVWGWAETTAVNKTNENIRKIGIRDFMYYIFYQSDKYIKQKS
jgi:hypothetical protein